MLQYKIGKIMRARGDCQGSLRAAPFTRRPARRGVRHGASVSGCRFDVSANSARSLAGSGGAHFAPGARPAAPSRGAGNT
jgi:hypothetical protein